MLTVRIQAIFDRYNVWMDVRPPLILPAILIKLMSCNFKRSYSVIQAILLKIIFHVFDFRLMDFVMKSKM